MSYVFNYATECFSCKPRLNAPKTDHQLNELRNLTAHYIIKGNLDVKLAMAYLLSLMQMSKYSYIVEKDWTSFKQLIGQSGQKVRLRDIVKYDFGEVNVSFNDTVPQCSDHNDKWIVIYICCINRIISTENDSYRNSIVGKINQLLQKNGSPTQMNAKVIHNTYKDWNYDDGYPVLMAAMDMYFAKFPNHKLAEARMGTEIARYKGCRVLSDLLDLLKITEFEISTLKCWIWTRYLADDLGRILYPDQEIDIEDSYVPYCISMKIYRDIPCKAYSSQVNPNMYLWINVIGATIGNIKSLNAIHFKRFYQITTIETAIVLAYALAINKGIIKSNTADECHTSEPIGLNPQEWIIWYKRNGEKLPEYAQNKLKEIWSGFQDVRNGTIGGLLKKISQENNMNRISFIINE